jgi:hypothetical protein
MGAFFTGDGEYDVVGTVYKGRAAKSYAQTVRLADNNQFVVGFMGGYEDVLVKIDGRWYIESRKLVSFIPPAAAPVAR